MKLHTIALVIIPLFFVGASSTCTNTMLVKTASGPDSSCSGFATSDNRSHLWPVSTDTTLCHGWKGYAAQDNKMHDNSANNIRCSTSDGKTKLLYTQFANSLDCSGTGVDKEYVLNECHQGVPPSLYDTGVNMDCCTDPEGASCTGTYTGQAAVAESPSLTDISIYENGAQCGGSGDTGTTGGSDTGTTGGGNTGTTGGGNTGTTGGGNTGTTGGGGGNKGTTGGGGGNTGTTGGTSTASSAQVVFSTLSSLLLFFAL